MLRPAEKLLESNFAEIGSKGLKILYFLDLGGGGRREGGCNSPLGGQSQMNGVGPRACVSIEWQPGVGVCLSRGPRIGCDRASRDSDQ
jgi:hypothetical protein